MLYQNEMVRFLILAPGFTAEETKYFPVRWGREVFKVWALHWNLNFPFFVFMILFRPVGLATWAPSLNTHSFYSWHIFLSTKLLGACVTHFYSHTFGPYLYTSSIFLAQGNKLHSLSFAKYKWRSTMICQKLCLALEIRKMKRKKKSFSLCHKDLPIVISRHEINHFGGRC